MHRHPIIVPCVLLVILALGSAALRTVSADRQFALASSSGASLKQAVDSITDFGSDSDTSITESRSRIELGCSKHVETLRRSAKVGHALPHVYALLSLLFQPSSVGSHANCYFDLGILLFLSGRHAREALRNLHSRQAGPVTVSLDSSYTNASLEAEVCRGLESGPTTLTIEGISRRSVVRENLFFTLPSCVYGANGLIFISLSRVIIQDTSIDKDNKASLNVFAPTLAGLVLYDSIITSATGSTGPFSIDWPNLFSSYPSMNQLVLQKMGLTGPLPSTLPALFTAVELSHNRFNGPISGSLFSTISPVSTSMTFKATYNRLTGSLPIFPLLPSTSLTEIILDFSHNNLTGSIPNGWLASLQLAGFAQPQLNVAFNQLSGTLPADLLNLNLAPYRPFVTVAMDVSHNRISGTLPSSLLSPSSLTQIEFYADHNLLSGEIPADLFNPSNKGVNLTHLTLSVTNNNLGGSLPDTLFKNARFIWPATYSTGAAHISFASNAISGTIPDSFFELSNYPLSTVSLDFSDNELSGSVKPSLLWIQPPVPTTSINFALNLSSNLLTGTIHDELLSSPYVNESFPVFGQLSLDLSRNLLSSTISPSFLSNSNFLKMGIFNVDFSHNKLAGLIPPTTFNLKTNIVDFAEDVIVSFAHNELSGAVPALIIGNSTGGGFFNSLSFDFSSNKLTSMADLIGGTVKISGIKRFSLSYKDNSIVGPLPISLLSSPLLLLSDSLNVRPTSSP